MFIFTGCGNDSGDSSKSPVINNIAPTISVSNVSAVETSEVTLSSTATDTDGTIQNYEWIQTSGDSVTLNNADTASASFTAPEITNDQTLGFQITVTDDGGLTASADVTVSVIAFVAPTVSADNQSAEESSVVTLSATATDTDGSIQTYEWTQTSGDSVTLDDASSASASFTAPEVTEDQTLGFQITVTDNDGLTASTNATVDITAKMLDVSIAGVVTDGPIANANVLLEVGEQSFTTQADENGAYSIDVSVDDSYIDSIVKATATGSDANSIIKLVSYFGILSSILEGAGNDATLTSDELFNTNITNVSTAVAASLELAVGGEIFTLEALEAAQTNLDGNLILPFATAIKLVIDYASENPDLTLPDTVTDTFALLKDQDTITPYISYIEESYAEEYAAAQSLILKDDSLIDSSINESNVIDTYYFFVVSSSTSQGQQLVLNDDHTGKEIFYERRDTGSGETELTWELTETGYTITYIEPETYSSSTYINDEIGYTEVYSSIISKNINILVELTDTVLISTSSTWLFEFPEGEFESYTETDIPIQKLIMKSSAVKSSVGQLEMGIEYALSLPYFHNTITIPEGLSELSNTDAQSSYAYAVFSGDSDIGGSVTLNYPNTGFDGITTFEETQATWSIDDSGNLLITYSEGYIETSLLDISNNNTLLASVLVNEENNGYTAASTDYQLKRTTTWTLDNIPGIYALDWGVLGDPDTLFWLDLNEDGTGTQNNSYEDNEGIVSISSLSILWQLNESGILSIRRYYGTEGYCDPEEFDPSPQADCNLYNDRELDLLTTTEVNGEKRIHTLHTHKFYFDYRLKQIDPNYTEHALQFISAGIRYWIKLDDTPVLAEGTGQSVTQLPLEKTLKDYSRFDVKE
ncbi:MAG: hypothetical protein ABJD02_13230 [Paraglaciecola sp.]|uniref:PKD domain-containing protein n=1 Tax=Paraglaciecola sp. TaxID=1920173 RepID=UPI0032663AC2